MDMVNTWHAQGAKDLTRSEQAYHLLKSAIVKGELSTGSKINESDLAKRYGVSRAPLREAISRLEAHRLLERTPHIGTRVVSLSVKQLIELYQIRATLEGLACRLTAEKRSSAVIIELENILALHAQDSNFKAGHGYYLQDMDDDFHYCIIKNSGNESLSKMLCDELYHLIRLYRIQFSKTTERAQRAFFEHHQILDALKNGDGELAEMLMKRHIMASCQNICDKLNQDTSQGINQDVS